MHAIERHFRAFESRFGATLDALAAIERSRRRDSAVVVSSSVAAAHAPRSVRGDARAHALWVDAAVAWSAYRRVRRIYVVHRRSPASLAARPPSGLGAGAAFSVVPASGRARVHVVAHLDDGARSETVVLALAMVSLTGLVTRVGALQAGELEPVQLPGALDREVRCRRALAASIAAALDEIASASAVYVDGVTSALVRGGVRSAPESAPGFKER